MALAVTETAVACPFDLVQHPKQKEVLRWLCEFGSIVRACREAGIDRTTPWYWKADPNWVAACDYAKQLYTEKLLDNVDSRAFNRDDDDKTTKSDLLAMFRVKALAPEHRDNFNQFNNNLTINLVAEDASRGALEGLLKQYAGSLPGANQGEQGIQDVDFSPVDSGNQADSH